MHKLFKTLHNLSQNLGLLLSLSLLLLPAVPSLADAPALALAGPLNESQFKDLAGRDLEIYARFYALQGGDYLLLPAGEALQADLVQHNIPLQVLDAQADPGSFVLVYGLPADLERAKASVSIIWQEGRLGIARATPEEAASLYSLGLKTRPLQSQRLSDLPVAGDLPPTAAPMQPESIVTGPVVQEMAAQVRSDFLRTLDGNLSGAWPVTIDGSPYTLNTRYTYTDIPIKKATRYAYEYFQGLGLPTSYDYYLISGYERRSVIAQKTGLTQPGRIFLLTAHLDSYSSSAPYSSAPGADDNASGSAAVMHLASILNQYNFGCTIRYALFTGEEQGMFGSSAYASDVYSAGENVEAVLNLDMLAYNTSGSPSVMELHTRPGNSQDLSIASVFVNTVLGYGFNINPVILQDGEGFSDHASFWDYGYPAVLAIEDWADHTPYYHTGSDILSTLSMNYYTEISKAALATIAHLGCLLDGQAKGVVRNQVNQQPISGIKVEAWQGANRVSTATTDANGNYKFKLMANTYRLVFASPAYKPVTANNITVVANQATVQNAVLQPCLTVQGANFTFTPALPGVNQTVAFTAAILSGLQPVTYQWNFADGSTASGISVTHSFTNQGAYPVTLSADNTCAAPAVVTRPVFVDVKRIFLPLVTLTP